MRIIGHRGAKGLAPENTLAAIQIALDLNVDAIEYDILTTADGRCVIHHDPVITTADGNQVVIAEKTYDELMAIKPDMPTFEQVIELVNKRCLLWTEVKPEADPEIVAKVVEQYLAKGWHSKDFLFVSFSQPVLLSLHQRFPSIAVAVNEDYWSYRAIRRAKELGTKTIVMNQKFLWFSFVKAMSLRGYQLGTFTLNDVALAKKWQKYGLTAVCTDYPDRFVNKLD